MAEIWSYEDNWLGAAQVLWPWGESGTQLHDFRGPKIWQHEELASIDDYRANAAKLLAVYKPIKAEVDDLITRFLNTHDAASKEALHRRKEEKRQALALCTPKPYMWTCRSGHGTGKDAFFSIIDVIFMTMCRGGTSRTTANTETQILTKTAPEMHKWYRLAVHAHWWDLENKLEIKPAKWYRDLLENQSKIDCGKHTSMCVTWDEHNAEAFTGEHNWLGMLFKKSECSNIADTIWDAVDGVWTEPIRDRFDLNVGNPWRDTGRFHESHHKNKHLYRLRHLDTRAVEDTDPNFEANIREKHGLDSLQYEVQVKGNFPTSAGERFFKAKLIEAARARPLFPDRGAPLTYGIDVARGGGDLSVGFPRRGLDLTMEPDVFNVRDLALVTDFFERKINALLPLGLQRVFVDGIGMGAGVGDHLRQRFARAGYPQLVIVIDSQSLDPLDWGDPDEDDVIYHDLSSALWGRMRKAMSLASLGPHKRFNFDLSERKEGVDKRTNKVKLEPKDDMRDRDLPSPDFADAASITYYSDVPRLDYLAGHGRARPTHAGGLNPTTGPRKAPQPQPMAGGRPAHAAGLQPKVRREYA